MPGEIETIVDQVEIALIGSKCQLYQRGGLIVCVVPERSLASDGSEITVQRIAERGDYALQEDMSSAARFPRLDKRADEYVRKDPPMELVRTLKERQGRLPFPPLTGIINVPVMRADGSVLSEPGYDRSTGLLFDPLGAAFPTIADRPTQYDAEKALDVIEALLEKFPFVGDKDRSVALSAIITACSRHLYSTAPLHAVTAPDPGSGKTKIVDIANIIAFGRRAPVMAQGASEEELEKRLAAALLAGDGAINIDNCSRPVASDFLCQLLTQTRIKLRILGQSKVPELSANAFVTATGNNIVLSGDLTRRTLLCRIDPKCERPENRVFEWDPVKVAASRRVDFATAVLTILRAYHVAGRPGAPPTLGSYEEWSDLVRGALLWLDCADPVASMDDVRRADPKLIELRSIIDQWRTHIGRTPVTVADLIRCATKRTDPQDGEPSEFECLNFGDALLAVAGDGNAVNGRRMGKWLAANRDRIVEGASIRNHGMRQGVMVWALDY